jgi:hypothetical protein
VASYFIREFTEGDKIMECNIMIVKIGERRKKSPEVQEVLSKFGCSIKTRLGLHEAGDVCSEEGVLVLELRLLTLSEPNEDGLLVMRGRNIQQRVIRIPHSPDEC